MYMNKLNSLFWSLSLLSLVPRKIVAGAIKKCLIFCW